MGWDIYCCLTRQRGATSNGRHDSTTAAKTAIIHTYDGLQGSSKGFISIHIHGHEALDAAWYGLQPTGLIDLLGWLVFHYGECASSDSAPFAAAAISRLTGRLRSWRRPRTEHMRCMYLEHG